ncbi:MAG: hypothetical protein GX621_06415, partial [Pirellulaceae bacterium]|nr:hypothetical protein [Pirellulaceae bacterium]
MLDRATIRTFWRGMLLTVAALAAICPAAWSPSALVLAQEAVQEAVAGEAPAAETPPQPATMPEGWRQLGVAEFVAAWDALTRARPRAEAAHVKEVVAHAWTTFLNDEQFLAEGDWPAIRALTRQFTARRRLLVEGETEEARAASQERVDQWMAALKSRLESRLADDPGAVNRVSFDELAASIAMLEGMKVNAAKRVDCYAGWMRSNDWRSLPIENQALLYSKLSHYDQVDPKCVSIRWTGSLRAPADGAYRFEQARTYYTDGKMKLWIDGQLVLDSPGVRHEEDCYCEIQPEVAREKFVSSPVALRAGEAVDFRLEYVHDMTGAKLRGIYPMGFPMAVLTWESELVERRIVPQTAFTPPAGFAEPGEKGLKGEYFGDAAFGETRATRLDPAIDFAWRERGPLCAKYAVERSELAEAIVPRLTSPTYLASRAADKKSSEFARMSVTQLIEGLSTS